MVSDLVGVSRKAGEAQTGTEQPWDGHGQDVWPRAFREGCPGRERDFHEVFGYIDAQYGPAPRRQSVVSISLQLAEPAVSLPALCSRVHATWDGRKPAKGQVASNAKNRKAFMLTLSGRLRDIDKKRRPNRIEKVIKWMSNGS